MSTKPYRIDVHHHVLPPDYVKAVARHGFEAGGDIPFPAWSVETALEVMDRCGIATAMTSVVSPGVYFGDKAEARDLSRQVNQIQADLVRKYPQRFGTFASLPVPDVDGALGEVEYALDTLRLDGVVLLASVGDQYLGDPALDPLFAELNRRKAVVFVHPNIPVSSLKLGLSMPAALIEFVFDTTRAITNLIFSGTLERYPDMKMIFSHAGGAIPFLAWRLALAKVIPALDAKAPQGAITYLKRLYYDVAMAATPFQLTSLRELVEPSRILFGSDHPFLPEPFIHDMTRGIADSKVLDAPARRAVERDNALALFPRLRAAQEAA
jgi:predicted TIM-barrel fold metal-dependent hydrolase